MKANPVNMVLLLVLYCKCSGKKGIPNMPGIGRQKYLKPQVRAKSSMETVHVNSVLHVAYFQQSHIIKTQ